MSSTLRQLGYLRWVPAILWMALIFWLSSKEAIPAPPGISYTFGAIAGHFLMYFVLTILLLIAFVDSSLRSAKVLIAIGVVAMLYGLSDEFHQSFVPGRDASPEDLLVDLVGIVCALTVWAGLWRRTATS